ncbi:hypothetical protein ES332_D12G178800v1 [Gossypium tomentosum]|uniref:Uncharacterized protein n=1 Tax=Gossypium tomentosum TaxID=34277 RepID=A0A5D2IA04_GOSTO|nr:hypothetical protein ES332_D12G178800v1 [Gossypium tomentosum]
MAMVRQEFIYLVTLILGHAMCTISISPALLPVVSMRPSLGLITSIMKLSSSVDSLGCLFPFIHNLLHQILTF